MTKHAAEFFDLVEGHQLQLTDNEDRSRTLVAIHMYENRLYILEGTVPDGDREPGLFRLWLAFVNEGRCWRALSGLLRQRNLGSDGPCERPVISHRCSARKESVDLPLFSSR